MRFVLQYPDLHGTDHDLLDAGSITEVASAAEAAGFDAVALTEHPAPSATWLHANGHQTLDPFVALAHAAAVTTRLRLVTYLAVLPYRNPFLLAKSAATLERLSGGRFVLGAGTGYLKSEFYATGTSFEERNDLLDEVLDVLPLAWSGQACSYRGRHFEARNVQCRPAPRTTIPIWLGGNSTLTLRRVAERAQGWMPLITSPELASTIRSAHIGTPDDLAARLRVLRDMAGDRFELLDIVVAYRDRTIFDLDNLSTARHHENIEVLADLGVSWLVLAPPWSPSPSLFDVITGLGDLYLAPTGGAQPSP